MLLKKIQEIASLARPRGSYQALTRVLLCANKKPRSMVERGFEFRLPAFAIAI
jgi:hypothetical protein